MTPGMDVVETQDYGLPGSGYPTVNQSGLFIENDSLEAAWSPSQKLEDTVARLQRDVAVYRKELRFVGGQGPANPPQSRGRSEFTSTPVPRYAGKSSWGQYWQVFAAIACSNGWSPTTAALQLFAHLDGEALNVALLMPVEERERWRAFVRGLSDYFNSPSRLAAAWWRFESASRRPGADPATFATELGVLAMQGFDSMGECAHGLMIRNKFIAPQPSRALRRHLDGASAEVSIVDIVDSCRVWESHAEDGYDGPDLKFPHTRTSVDGRSYTPGKREWSGREGQPSGSSGIVVRLTLEGECRLGGGAPASLAATIGGRPWISLDPRCPGLSDTGEPLFDEGWTAWTSGVR